tara:strand:+ start:1071 stop:1427 length:357 start_codon:yes stop_codon:yes gene_type:complete
VSSYKNKLERGMGQLLETEGVPFSYEDTFLYYDKRHRYHPDFHLTDKDIFIEVKGWFLPVDRAKHLLIKAQHPEVDIRFAFQNPNAKLRKGSKTSYADWCDKHGFDWCGLKVPKAWIS